jgi:hypothetical protein
MYKVIITPPAVIRPKHVPTSQSHLNGAVGHTAGLNAVVSKHTISGPVGNQTLPTELVNLVMAIYPKAEHRNRAAAMLLLF